MHPSQQAEQHTLVSHPVATKNPREFFTGEASNDAFFGLYNEFHISRQRVLFLLYVNPQVLLTQEEESRLIALDMEYRRIHHVLERIASGRQDQVHACTLRCLMIRQKVSQPEDLQSPLPEAVADKHQRLNSRAVLLVTAIEFIIGDLTAHLVESRQN